MNRTRRTALSVKQLDHMEFMQPPHGNEPRFIAAKNARLITLTLRIYALGRPRFLFKPVVIIPTAQAFKRVQAEEPDESVFLELFDMFYFVPYPALIL